MNTRKRPTMTRKGTRMVRTTPKPDATAPLAIEVPGPRGMPTSLYAANEVLQGKYCNVGVIKHTAREFVFDFILSLEGHLLLASRIITSPAHAKALYEALGTNIERYEKAHGKIQIGEAKESSDSAH